MNQPTPSSEHEEEPTKDDGEPIEDNGEPVDDKEEEALQVVEEEEEEDEKEEEALMEEVDNITKTIPPGFGPMPRNTIVEDEDDSSSE